MRLWTAIVLTLGVGAFTPGLVAHHSFGGEFDNSIAVTLKGVVTSVELVNPHSFIYLDVKSAEGRVERWALEGPNPRQIVRMGLQVDWIKPGDELGACGYLARRDVAPTRTEPITARAARKLQAAVLMIPHHDPRLWNNYGQEKCGLDVRPWSHSRR
jgi:hypothetical protein